MNKQTVYKHSLALVANISRDVRHMYKARKIKYSAFRCLEHVRGKSVKAFLKKYQYNRVCISGTEV